MNSKIQAVLFDLDGLVFERRPKLFSEQYAEEYKVPLEDVREFFVKDLKPCSMGKADLKEKIAPYLKKWNWPHSVNEFLDYWFRNRDEIDETVMYRVSELRDCKIGCYIATRQEKYRMAYIMDDLGLNQLFDGAFSTCEIGYDKSEREYWTYVLQKLGLQPEEILYFDDTDKNVAMAKSLGINAHLCKDPVVFENEMAMLLD
jgi:putative hydrolase of the HAD superfamily